MRARNLKPGLFKNEELGTAEPLYTLIFEGLWTLADREGRLEDRPLRIHAEINPYREPNGTLAAIDWLVERGFILRYEIGGNRYLQVLTFHKHQNPHQRESPSEIPPPAGVTDRYSDQPVTEPQRRRILSRDGSCQTCGSSEDLQVDHVVPRTAGGSSDDENLQALCRPCNVRKGGRHSLGNGETQPRHDQGTAKAMPSPASSLIPPSPFLTPDSPFPNSPNSVSVPHRRDVARIFEFWKVTWQHPKAKLDPKRHRLIAAALKAYSEADLRACISGYLNSSHHCGENDRRAVYDDIGLFLRDAAHIDAGLAFGQDRHPAKPELILRTEAEFHAYEAATKQGLSFASQDEWEAHQRGRQTH